MALGPHISIQIFQSAHVGLHLILPRSVWGLMCDIQQVILSRGLVTIQVSHGDERHPPNSSLR